ncbi:hypothetical protein GCM10010306_096810 [Streptomyces umbrinus]|nr:hypothetical protein GCM10010306_096810 [Streptomyces umbrinus]
MWARKRPGRLPVCDVEDLALELLAESGFLGVSGASERRMRAGLSGSRACPLRRRALPRPTRYSEATAGFLAAHQRRTRCDVVHIGYLSRPVRAACPMGVTDTEVGARPWETP